MNFLFSMFCLGCYTLLAQMLVMRELAVVCLGNELTIGVVFSVWLVLIGAGARVGTLGRLTPAALVYIFVWLAIILPLMILALRLGAGWIRPPGEYVALDKVFAACFLVLLPVCVPAGMAFTLGCEARFRRGFEQVVSDVYTVEALGSFLAAVVFTFGLTSTFNLCQISLFASTVALIGAASLAASSWGRGLLILMAGALFLSGLSSSLGERLNWRSVEMRWASLGVTHDGRDGRPAVTLKAGRDTRYQNLALLEGGGQFSIYGDGEILFSFPDDITCERAVNFVMAQKPDARRVLLLGGNPAGELPYLLKYPVEEIVWVERDPSLEDQIRIGVPDLYGRLECDPRLKRVWEDGPRFVKRCRDRFDVVLVHAPEPVTGGLNRLYTLEFYRDIRHLLTPGGFMHTSIEASERLEEDASRVAASIYKTLQAVFPAVCVTAGTPLQYFASGSDGTLSLDRDVLYRRSASAHVVRKTFRPEYFLDADELDPAKIVFTEQRLTQRVAPKNTISQPVSCYYTLILWSRFSHSSFEHLFRRVAAWRSGWVLSGLGGIGLLMILVTLIARRQRPAGLPGLAVWQAMAMAGFGGVALELILLYAYQGIHGYVYSRMGFMVGLFMLGAVTGAWQVRKLESAGYDLAWRVVVLCLLMLVVLAGGVQVCLGNAVTSEWLLYGLTMATGAVVAMQFVAVNRLSVLSGAAPGKAAGRAWLADYCGSAFGGLLVGIFLMSVFGIGVTCLLLAIGFVISLMIFIILIPRHRE